MVKLTKTIKLMGQTITVTESSEGEFEDRTRFIKQHKHLFKYYSDFRLTGRALVTEKKLMTSDIRQDQNRLHVPMSGALCGLLNPGERTRLLVNRGHLEVPTVDPAGRSYNMKLKLWRSVESRGKLVLINKWAKLVKDNGLKTDDVVQLWGFRDVNDRLHFAVNLREDREPVIRDEDKQ